MHNPISNKLFRGTSQQARTHIQDRVQNQGYCVVSFLYFAQAMKFDLFKETKPSGVNASLRQDYKNALLRSDLVCIDGIAMQLFDWCGQLFFTPKKRPWTENLNGTDFLPYILNHTTHQKIGIILSSVYDPQLGKGAERMGKGLKALKNQFPHIDILFSYQSVFQKRGEQFPFSDLQKIIQQEKGNYDHILFLNGIGSPIQEIWTERHKAFFENTNIIILNNGATIDYYSGFEKRAPQRVVKMRVGETLWRIATQPKKNLHKFFSMFAIFSYRKYILTQRRKNKKTSGKFK